jgi:hypothetical protein
MPFSSRFDFLRFYMARVKSRLGDVATPAH